MIPFDPIPLAPEDASLLRKFEDQRAANMATAEQFRAACERRNTEFMAQGREIWGTLAKKYNLDMANVSYNLNNTGDALVIVAAQFPTGGQ